MKRDNLPQASPDSSSNSTSREALSLREASLQEAPSWRRPNWIVRLGLPLGLVAAALLMMQSTLHLQQANTTPRAQSALRFDPDLALHPAGSPLRVATRDIPLMLPLERGQTLGSVLGDFGLEPAEARDVVEALAEHVDPRRLRAGDPYAAYLEEDGALHAFQLVVPEKGKVRVARDDQGWSTSWRDFVRTERLSQVRGTLEGALETAIRDAGGRPSVAFLMADALQWDLDFNRDLRTGDRFEALFEEVYLDGRYHGLGRLLAVVYETRGQRLEGFRFDGEGRGGDDGGFYDAEGRPLWKMFLRSPMRYSRVTSQFSHRRFHPVLKTYRPHYGVDYGAPTGTPVRVTASGTVNFAGWNGGAGRMVRVRHPNDYETAYLHLSGFADGIRSGARVSQGQVVGYVGSTGLSTGPHLDYRVKHRGSYINPGSLKTMPAEPIAQKDLPEFIAWRDALRHSMATGEPLPEDPFRVDEPDATALQIAGQSDREAADGATVRTR